MFGNSQNLCGRIYEFVLCRCANNQLTLKIMMPNEGSDFGRPI